MTESEKRQKLKELKELNVALREKQHRRDLEFYANLPKVPVRQRQAYKFEFRKLKKELDLERAALRIEIKKLDSQIQKKKYGTNYRCNVEKVAG